MEGPSRLVELYYYLQDPHLVARFQHRCGVQGTFSRTVAATGSATSSGGSSSSSSSAAEEDRTHSLNNGACCRHIPGGNEPQNVDLFGAGDGQHGHATTTLRQRTVVDPKNAIKSRAEEDDDDRRPQNGALMSKATAGGDAVCPGGEGLTAAWACGTDVQENDDGDNSSPPSLSPSPAAGGGSSSSTLKPLRKNSLTGDAGQEFVIENRFLYYLFTFGTELGNELFYIIFFPFVMWNVDVFVSRKLIMVWVWVMYLGQCTKDVIRWPRPASPPVVKVEMFYNSEYSMPSTHAMSGTAIPFSLFCMTYCRWEYPFLLGLGLALCWCLVVCVSRIYMGMHSVLDVMAGFLYSSLILLLLLPALDSVDAYYLSGRHAPLVIVALHLGMGLFSFTLDTWSTSRGDTAQILATGAGVALASHVNQQLGLLPDLAPDQLPLTMPALSAALVATAMLRHAVGVLVLMATRALMKAVTIPAVCWATGVPGDDVRKARQNMRVELPYRYIVYGTMGFNVLFLVPLLFRYLQLA